VRVTSIANAGAKIKISYYDTNRNFIQSQETTTQAETKDYTRYAVAVTPPENTTLAVVEGKVSSSVGVAYFDNIKLTRRATTQYKYDESGNYVTDIIDPLGNTMHYGYDEVGNQASATDARGNITTTMYDKQNNKTAVTDACGNTTRLKFDTVSKQANYRDARSMDENDTTYQTQFKYNEIGQLIKTIDPLGRETTQTYDDSGNLVLISYPNGKQVDYTYDKANRVAKRTLAGDNKYFAYKYDAAGNIKVVADEKGREYQYTYDNGNRVANQIDLMGLKTQYGLDKNGNQTSLKEDGYGEIKYEYGSDNQLLLVADAKGNSTKYYYDESGRVFQLSRGNNTKAFYNYDDSGRLTQIYDQGYTVSETAKMGLITYGYDANSNITEIAKSDGTDRFKYDALNRLREWYNSARNTAKTYSYDAVGNITSVEDGTETISFTYNASNEITNPGYFYDAYGNLVDDGTYRYEYNSENQLAKIIRTEDDTEVASYEYDYRGYRILKRTATEETHYNWDAMGHLISESGPDGQTMANYIYDQAGALIEIVKDGKEYYVHTNYRGDIVSITDSGQSIVASYKYGPWGEIIEENGSFDQPFRYAGYYYDKETQVEGRMGLYYLKGRYYSPSSYRFLTKDSITNENLYVYCHDNPNGLFDPDGFHDVKIGNQIAPELHWTQFRFDPSGGIFSILKYWTLDTFATWPVRTKKTPGKKGNINVYIETYEWRHGINKADLDQYYKDMKAVFEKEKSYASAALLFAAIITGQPEVIAVGIDRIKKVVGFLDFGLDLEELVDTSGTVVESGYYVRKYTLDIYTKRIVAPEYRVCSSGGGGSSSGSGSYGRGFSSNAGLRALYKGIDALLRAIGRR
jgi:RHS repeat-associated protein